MDSISVRLSPRSIALIFLGAIVLIVGSLSLYRYNRAREVVTWKGTIVSPSTEAEIIVQPVAVIHSFATSTTQGELIAEINRYWLERVNGLRREKQLSILLTDLRLVTTAGEWASEMERRGEITHVRTDGKTMHQWIDTKQLDFTKRGSVNGWKSNYFVENIARFYAKSSVEGMKEALDRILSDFLSEGPGGDHYESIYHPDWNSVGVGYAIHRAQDDSERVYFVFHYGSLNSIQP